MLQVRPDLGPKTVLPALRRACRTCVPIGMADAAMAPPYVAAGGTGAAVVHTCPVGP